MFQLAGLLIFFGFGSVVLYYMDYEFRLLSWLTEYQPVAGVLIGAAGLVALVVAFWLKSRKDGDESDVEAPAPPAVGPYAGGQQLPGQPGPGQPVPAQQHLAGPQGPQTAGGQPGPAPWTGPAPEQAYRQRAPQPGQPGAQQPGPQQPGPQQPGPYAAPPQQVPQPRHTAPQPGAPAPQAAYPPPPPGAYPPPYPPQQPPQYPANGAQPQYGPPPNPPR